MTQTKSKRPDRQLSPDKADAILSGAMQEFLEHGYAATSMDRVATTAGVSKATVYSHFQDKEGLFAALIKRMAQKKMAIIHGGQSLEGDPATVLPRMMTAGLDEIENDSQHLPFIRLIIAESGRFPELAQLFVQNLAKPSIELLTQYLAAQPQLRLSDPEATARIVIGAMVHYMQLQEMLQGKDIIPMERDRLINALVELILTNRS